MGDLREVEGMMSEKEKEKERTEEEDESGTESKGVELNGLMRWEKFLPKMVLRVLLVEADDSTRQIIAALLRKCSYRGLTSFCHSNCFFPFNFIALVCFFLLFWFFLIDNGCFSKLVNVQYGLVGYFCGFS